MHPAYSVILFTTASGAGYGLLFWMALAETFGVLPGGRALSLAALTFSLALITLGLLASTLHLGRPERAIGALSQWRTSWLSREGVAAVATYVPAGLLGLSWLIYLHNDLFHLVAALAAAGAAITVYCTGMIYGSLRTIRQWNTPLVPLFYLAAAASTGALLFGLIYSLFGYSTPLLEFLLLCLVAVSGAVKLTYWRQCDADKGQYTAEMATGLGAWGKVRPLDPPHTMPNFVMREMGYQVGRKHAQKLRRLVVLFLFAGPMLALALSALTGAGVFFWYLLAFLMTVVGIVTERWLFFAEAEHVSMLYYGAERA